MSPGIRIFAAFAASWLVPLLVTLAVQRFLQPPAEKAPLRRRSMLLGMLGLGAAALLLSQVLLRITMLLGAGSRPEMAQIAVEATFGAGIPEELAKWPLVLVLIRMTRATSRAAALLCGLSVGLGFAGYENALGAGHLDAQALLLSRFTATVAHGCWGVLMGWFIERALESPRPKAATLLVSFLIPALLHSLEDFLIGLSIPGSLLESSVVAPPEALPTAREAASALGAAVLWIGQLIWCGRIVRSCRSGLSWSEAAG